MARLETVRFQPHRATVDVDNNRLRWTPVKSGNTIARLPLIFWSTGLPWREANIWLTQAATEGDVDISTVESRASSLLFYAQWLESTKSKWWDFPKIKANRCLVRYRGNLIKLRRNGTLAPSTISQRMNVAIRFYRWLHENLLLSSEWPIWEDRTIGICIKDTFGFERSITVVTTDLSIPNRRLTNERLEDGMIPLHPDDRDEALKLAREHASEELFLMLNLGFFTGMRIGTIADLKIQTLERAVRDPLGDNFFRLAVGPKAAPPVATKFGVQGQIPIAKIILDEVLTYTSSATRMKREAVAGRENKDLVFLTRQGNSYCRNGSQSSNAINVEMHNFRKLAVKYDVPAIATLHFHQSRCTFATELAKLAIRVGGSMFSLSIVKEFLLHRNESTSLRYVKFVEKTPLMENAANAFTQVFLNFLSNIRTDRVGG
jgi:integrase